jgi:hypothetical protein
MGAQDVLDLVDLAEACNDPPAKGESGPAAPPDSQRPCPPAPTARARAPAYRSDGAKSSRSGCGSDHIRSASGPSVGISAVALFGQGQPKPQHHAAPRPVPPLHARADLGSGRGSESGPPSAATATGLAAGRGVSASPWPARGVGAPTAMDTKDAVVNDGGHGEVVEQVGKVPPHVAVAVLDQALFVKAIHLLRRLARVSAVSIGGGTVARTCVTVRVSWLPRSSVMRLG